RPTILFQLRPDPRRRRHAAQPAVGRQPGRRRGLARTGLLMTDVAVREDNDAPPPRVRIRRHWSRRLAGELAALLVALLLLLAIGLVALDTAPGHRWLVDRISEIETKSGLRFRIGRIEGSVFGESRLRNVQV